MPTITERNERMVRILTDLDAPVMWVQGESNTAPSLHDQDGDRVAVLPDQLIPVLDRMSDADVGAIVEAIAVVAVAESRRAFADGRVVGHQDTVARVHELLGIDRICAAISAAAEGE